MVAILRLRRIQVKGEIVRIMLRLINVRFCSFFSESVLNPSWIQVSFILIEGVLSSSWIQVFFILIEGVCLGLEEFYGL